MELNEVEKEIIDIITKDQISLPAKDLKALIRSKIVERKYINEDWQIGYAVDRIYEGVFATHEPSEVNTGESEKRINILYLGLILIILVIGVVIWDSNLNLIFKLVSYILVIAAFHWSWSKFKGVKS